MKAFIYDMDGVIADTEPVHMKAEQHVMKKKASGGVQSFVSLKFLRNYLLPLPPLAEQKRIVAKLEEILPMCERLK